MSNDVKSPFDQQGISVKAIILLLVILCFAATVRAVLFENVYAVDQTRIISPDTIRYEGPALTLLSDGTMHDGLDIANTQVVHEAPIYPFFIYSIYSLFGQDHRNVVYAQIIVSLFTIIVVFMIGKLLWGTNSALLGAGLMSIAPMQSMYSNILLSETVFVFFVLLMCWRAIIFLKNYSTNPKLRYAVLFGLTIGAATMVRPVAYYLVFCVAIAVCVFHFMHRSLPIGQLLKSVVLILLSFAVVVGPWHLRNKPITGAYMFTDNPGQIMLYWKAAGLIAHRDGIDHDTVRAQLKANMPTEYDSLAQKYELEKQAGLNIIKADIPGYLHFTADTIARILVGPGLAKFGNYLYGDDAGSIAKANSSSASSIEQLTGYQLSYLFVIAYSLLFLFAIYALFVIGGIRYWKQDKQRVVLVFCVAIICYFVLASSYNAYSDSVCWIWIIVDTSEIST